MGELGDRDLRDLSMTFQISDLPWTVRQTGYRIIGSTRFASTCEALLFGSIPAVGLCSLGLLFGLALAVAGVLD